MKILSIKLENFNMIKNAMNTNSLFIDFSDSINKICLIIWPNGSGKTTLLSMLHPFADLGNLDIRNGTNLIISGKDGYKEIVIKKMMISIQSNIITHHTAIRIIVSKVILKRMALKWM